MSDRQVPSSPFVGDDTGGCLSVFFCFFHFFGLRCCSSQMSDVVRLQFSSPSPSVLQLQFSGFPWCCSPLQCSCLVSVSIFIFSLFVFSSSFTSAVMTAGLRGPRRPIACGTVGPDRAAANGSSACCYFACLSFVCLCLICCIMLMHFPA